MEGFYKPDSSAKVQKLSLNHENEEDDEMAAIIQNLVEPRGTESHRGKQGRVEEEEHSDKESNVMAFNQTLKAAVSSEK